MTASQRDYLESSVACLACAPAGINPSGAAGAVGGIGSYGNSLIENYIDPVTGEPRRMTTNEKLARAMNKAIAEAATVSSDEDPTVRVRHYTTATGLTGIRLSTVIMPARGDTIGVFVEVCPCSPLKTAGVDWGTAEPRRTNSYVEFSARRDSLLTISNRVGPRNNGAVIPSLMPYPVGNKNPIYYQSPWWKIWEHPVSH